MTHDFSQTYLGQLRQIVRSDPPCLVPYAANQSTYPNGHVIHTFALLVHSVQWEGRLDESNEESLERKFFDRNEFPEMLINERASLKAYFRFEDTGEFQLG
ncbi:hypothetical protein WDW86_01140 [Bdellovibrionota bacterium FG-2]